MLKQIGSPIIGPSGHPLPLSAGIEVNGTVYLSGQLALADGRIVGEDVAEQTATILANIEELLADANLSIRDIFKVSVWLTRKENFPAFNAVFARAFSQPYPARSTVVSDLVVEGALIEIEVTATRMRDPVEA